MLSSEPCLTISHGYLFLWLPCVCYRNHWFGLLCLKVESKFKNLKLQWLPTNKVCDCYILTVKQLGSVVITGNQGLAVFTSSTVTSMAQGQEFTDEGAEDVNDSGFFWSHPLT